MTWFDYRVMRLPRSRFIEKDADDDMLRWSSASDYIPELRNSICHFVSVAAMPHGRLVISLRWAYRPFITTFAARFTENTVHLADVEGRYLAIMRELAGLLRTAYRHGYSAARAISLPPFDGAMPMMIIIDFGQICYKLMIRYYWISYRSPRDSLARNYFRDWVFKYNYQIGCWLDRVVIWSYGAIFITGLTIPHWI